ncbi:hypothetical protein MACK_003841 [Theileria orientalis]|uniref:Uncharacterized protein n=1 Tax=Theileria orientalis TaxID=68886 RepID=A0A976SJ05_THEOR|nr:hypothetical protein MACK_003841 [Theileria orientalis]UVC54312.1 hypothetical protein MACJ_003849 [Theileria orientalis]
MFVTRRLFHHKYAAPQGPKLQSLKDAITSKLNPICFYVKNDPNYSTYVQDEHFYGILCSPLFEGKTYSEMNEIVNGILEPLNLKGRVRLNCQPPSRYNKLKRHIRLRWNLDR